MEFEAERKGREVLGGICHVVESSWRREGVLLPHPDDEGRYEGRWEDLDRIDDRWADGGGPLQ